MSAASGDGLACSRAGAFVSYFTGCYYRRKTKQVLCPDMFVVLLRSFFWNGRETLNDISFREKRTRVTIDSGVSQ